MKIKDVLLNAFAAKQMVLGESLGNYNYRRRTNSNEVYQLEAIDFDKAIQILQMNNKRAGVKEFSLLKEEFLSFAVEGKYPADEEYQVYEFIRKLRETATKRLSDVETRKIRKMIDETWDITALENKANNIRKFYTKLQEATDYKAQIAILQKQDELQTTFIKDRQDWLKTQVDENEATLDSLDASDWEEYNHLYECFREQMKELNQYYD